MQNGKLFQGDIYSNIVISAPQLTLQEAWEAAELAGIADDIRSMPMGMHTIISEGSGGISGGQRQRLAIARTLVAQPEILILDEPTSNLDVRYQMDVMRFLKDYAREKGILVLMVCHDLNITAAYADRVVLMHNGGIFADGKASDVLTEENIETVYRVKARVMEIEGTYHIALLPE